MLVLNIVVLCVLVLNIVVLCIVLINVEVHCNNSALFVVLCAIEICVRLLHFELVCFVGFVFSISMLHFYVVVLSIVVF